MSCMLLNQIIININKNKFMQKHKKCHICIRLYAKAQNMSIFMYINNDSCISEQFNPKHFYHLNNLIFCNILFWIVLI